MKVLHLGKLCPPNEGGMELFTYDLLEYLNSKGVKADLLCFGDGSFERSYRNFHFYSCRMNIKLNSAPLSWDFIKTFKKIEKDYDIIHIHSPNPVAEILSLFTDKKVISHWHSDIVRQKASYYLYKPFQQMYLRKADKIICTSPQYLDSSSQLENFRYKSVVIPLGLNAQRLKSDKVHEKAKEEFLKLKNDGKKIVLSIGRLVEYKGFKYLVEAGRYVDPNTVIVIAGAGPLFASLSEEVKKLGLEERVILLGKVENVSFYMKNCDIFCLPSISRNEAFGLVLVEALYFEKPLVSTSIEGSGMSYVNKDGKTGLVVEPKNPKALADAINRILKDEDLYKQFSKNTREIFKEFEISSIGEKILSLYEEVIK